MIRNKILLSLISLITLSIGLQAAQADLKDGAARRSQAFKDYSIPKIYVPYKSALIRSALNSCLGTLLPSDLVKLCAQYCGDATLARTLLACGTSHVWTTRSAELCNIVLHEDKIVMVMIQRIDGKNLIRLFDITTGEPIEWHCQLEDNEYSDQKLKRKLEFSCAGNTLTDGNGRIWNIKTGNLIARFRGGFFGLSQDGTKVAYRCHGGQYIDSFDEREKDRSLAPFKRVILSDTQSCQDGLLVDRRGVYGIEGVVEFALYRINDPYMPIYHQRIDMSNIPCPQFNIIDKDTVIITGEKPSLLDCSKQPVVALSAAWDDSVALPSAIFRRSNKKYRQMEIAGENSRNCMVTRSNGDMYAVVKRELLAPSIKNKEPQVKETIFSVYKIDMARISALVAQFPDLEKLTEMLNIYSALRYSKSGQLVCSPGESELLEKLRKFDKDAHENLIKFLQLAPRK